MRRKTAAAAAAGALGLATLGGIGIGSALMSTAVADPLSTTVRAATADPTPADPSTTDPAAPDPADVARVAERTTRITEALAALVADGTITQAQADAVAQTLATTQGVGGPGGHGGGPGGGLGVLREGLATAASTLGVSEDDLRSQLESGSTLGEIADTAGVDRTTLVDALVTFAQEQVTARVTAGDLTQAQADEITADLETRVTDGLDRALPTGGPGGRGGHGHGPGTDDTTDDGDA